MKTKWITLVVLLLGVTQIAESSYLLVKAELAQVLMQKAWNKGLAGTPTPPWPWADSYPVARLMIDDHDIDQIVLAGASGRNLAFGPAYMLASAPPKDSGNTVLAGHRDTHFAFLADIQPGTLVRLQWIDGNTVDYMVEHIDIVDSRVERLDLDSTGQRLTLVTCYPFAALQAGGPLRFVVTAIASTD